MANRDQLSGTFAAVFTVGLWGSLPVLRGLANLPPMLIAAVAMATAGTVAGLVATARAPQAASGAGSAAAHWLMGVGGLVGALYFYFLALGLGNPAQVTLITYMWPLGFVLACDRLAGNGVRVTVAIGTGIAFAAVTPLLLEGGRSGGLPLAAVIAGLLSGASWIAFSLYLRRDDNIGMHGYRRLFFQAGLLSLVLHLLFEDWPTTALARDWAVAALIGLGPYGLAFMAWGYALRRGPSGLLGALAYAVPVIAAGYLVILGVSAPSTELIIAATGVFGGAVITEKPWQRLRLHAQPG